METYSMGIFTSLIQNKNLASTYINSFPNFPIFTAKPKRPSLRVLFTTMSKRTASCCRSKQPSSFHSIILVCCAVILSSKTNDTKSKWNFLGMRVSGGAWQNYLTGNEPCWPIVSNTCTWYVITKLRSNSVQSFSLFTLTEAQFMPFHSLDVCPLFTVSNKSWVSSCEQ